MSQKITPFLWFDDNAEEAINFYTSVFKNSSKGNITRFGPEVPGPAGKVIMGSFKLEDQEFLVLNGGPEFTFNEAVSFLVSCDDQEEVDYYWEKLSEGGQPGQCGWLKDQFGLSWQIIPKQLDQLMSDPDPERAKRATETMLKMTKIDIAQLEEAADHS